MEAVSISDQTSERPPTSTQSSNPAEAQTWNPLKPMIPEPMSLRDLIVKNSGRVWKHPELWTSQHLHLLDCHIVVIPNLFRSTKSASIHLLPQLPETSDINAQLIDIAQAQVHSERDIHIHQLFNACISALKYRNPRTLLYRTGDWRLHFYYDKIETTRVGGQLHAHSRDGLNAFIYIDSTWIRSQTSSGQLFARRRRLMEKKARIKAPSADQVKFTPIQGVNLAYVVALLIAIGQNYRFYMMPKASTPYSTTRAHVFVPTEDRTGVYQFTAVFDHGEDQGEGGGRFLDKLDEPYVYSDSRLFVQRRELPFDRPAALLAAIREACSGGDM